MKNNLYDIEDKLQSIAVHYGYRSQKKQLIEEIAELTQALIKEDRYPDRHDECVKNIIEEIADVQIMIYQMNVLLKINQQEYLDIYEQKVDRQIARIHAEKEEGKQTEECKQTDEIAIFNRFYDAMNKSVDLCSMCALRPICTRYEDESRCRENVYKWFKNRGM